MAFLLAGAAIPLFADKPPMTPIDVNQAREITQLIEQGQIGLPEAIRLAETKSNGKALECFARLEFGTPTMTQPPTGADKPIGERPPGQTGATKPGMDKDMNAKRVVYHVQVFSDGQLKPFFVDAKTREVMPLGDRFKQTGDRPIIDRDRP
jgi:hypothetical protein